jgi:hypothetical protein
MAWKKILDRSYRFEYEQEAAYVYYGRPKTERVGIPGNYQDDEEVE